MKYLTEIVKGKTIKLGDTIWYSGEFRKIVIIEFRDTLKKNYPDENFLKLVMGKTK